MARWRGFINQAQLETVIIKILGSESKKLVARVGWGISVGPVFAWYLLAKGVKSTVTMAESLDEGKLTEKHYLEFKAA